MQTPAITVLMPVHNGATHLPAALASILAQTFTDFEFLIIDDGSTDDSAAILRRQTDSRIRLQRQPANLGIVATLNSGLALARAPYVARMDADDIAQPGRLEKQYAFLQAHPDIGLCGSAFEEFDERAGPGWVRYLDHEALQVALLFENPVCHPTVMMRRSVLVDHGLSYPADFPHAEEYALWTQLIRRTRLANLADPLLRYRTHAGQISRTKSEVQCQSIDRLIRQQLAGLGLSDLRPRDLAVHKVLGGGFYPLPGLPAVLDRWIGRLIGANGTSRFTAPTELEHQLAARRTAALIRTRDTLQAMPAWRRLQWRALTWKNHYLLAA